MHKHLYVLYICSVYIIVQTIHRTSVAWETTNSWITLSQEFQLLAPRQNVVYTMLYSSDVFFCLSGHFITQDTRGSISCTKQWFRLFLCYLFLAFTEAEVTEAGTHHHLFHKKNLQNTRDGWVLPGPAVPGAPASVPPAEVGNHLSRAEWLETGAKLPLTESIHP